VTESTGITPQGLLSEMLLHSHEYEGVLVIAILKDGKVRHGWSNMNQVMRMGALKALQVESDAAWLNSDVEDKE
jgi:hypothetical protein